MIQLLVSHYCIYHTLNKFLNPALINEEGILHYVDRMCFHSTTNVTGTLESQQEIKYMSSLLACFRSLELYLSSSYHKQYPTQ
jgi:hypothetical protein